MKKWSKIGFFVTLLFVCFLTGCRATLSSRIQAKAERKPLRVAIRGNPAEHKGKTLILGGEVLGLVYQGRKTEVEFSEIPLDRALHPVRGMHPGKSYYVLFPRRLDKSLYSKGKLATVAASWMGIKEKDGLAYPLFSYEEIHIWNKLRERRFPHYGVH